MPLLGQICHSLQSCFCFTWNKLNYEVNLICWTDYAFHKFFFLIGLVVIVIPSHHLHIIFESNSTLYFCLEEGKLCVYVFVIYLYVFSTLFYVGLLSEYAKCQFLLCSPSPSLDWVAYAVRWRANFTPDILMRKFLAILMFCLVSMILSFLLWYNLLFVFMYLFVSYLLLECD